MSLTTRIAPTPSGFLHIGNVYSFVLTWLIARKQNGKLWLRIDDLDNTRLRPAYVADIFETLEFLDLSYDAGPTGPDDFFSRHSQEFSIPQYNSMLQKLVETGLVYACTCSRKQARLGNNSTFADVCREKHLPLNTRGAAWRIQTPEHTQVKFSDEFLGDVTINVGKEMPDFIIRKKEGLPAYQVASLCDDIDREINYLVRGRDLLASTAAQLYLAKLIGNTSFSNSRFCHHPLLETEPGRKLSKSAGSLSVRHLRTAGKSKTDILTMLQGMPGIPSNPHPVDLPGLLEKFSPDDIAIKE